MTTGRERRFGRTSERAEGLLTSGEYLEVPALLSLQRLRSDPPVHDELLFIVVHQAYELWFKQLLFELGSVRDRLFADDTERARHYLTRIHAIERVLIEHIEVLETMTPQDFLDFRDHLAPPDERARLERRLEEPTLWDGFCSLLETHGLPMPPDDPERRAASLVAMAREQRDLFAVSEGLLDHDENIARWRALHVLMVEREIGAKTGTGGSSGVAYLRSTLDKRFFPELWGLRSAL
jgi:tryptophan 2,3-dioxygenase